jgi:hypothetical protein
MHPQQTFIRRGIHHFVHGLCAMAIGITPPSEKQEVPFFLALVGFFILVVGMMYVVGTVVSNF